MTDSGRALSNIPFDIKTFVFIRRSDEHVWIWGKPVKVTKIDTSWRIDPITETLGGSDGIFSL